MEHFGLAMPCSGGPKPGMFVVSIAVITPSLADGGSGTRRLSPIAGTSIGISSAEKWIKAKLIQYRSSTR
jgi:hypothetical protein